MKRNNVGMNIIGGVGVVLSAGLAIPMLYSAPQVPEFYNTEAMTAALDAIERVPGVSYDWTGQEDIFSGERPNDMSPQAAVSYALEKVHESHISNPVYNTEFSELESDIISVMDTISSIDSAGISIDPVVFYAPVLTELGNKIRSVQGYSAAKGMSYLLGGMFAVLSGTLALSMVLTNLPPPKPQPDTEQNHQIQKED